MIQPLTPLKCICDGHITSLNCNRQQHCRIVLFRWCDNKIDSLACAIASCDNKTGRLNENRQRTDLPIRTFRTIAPPWTASVRTATSWRNSTMPASTTGLPTNSCEAAPTTASVRRSSKCTSNAWRCVSSDYITRVLLLMIHHCNFAVLSGSDEGAKYRIQGNRYEPPWIGAGIQNTAPENVRSRQLRGHRRNQIQLLIDKYSSKWKTKHNGLIVNRQVHVDEIDWINNVSEKHRLLVAHRSIS